MTCRPASLFMKESGVRSQETELAWSDLLACLTFYEGVRGQESGNRIGME